MLLLFLLLLGRLAHTAAQGEILSQTAPFTTGKSSPQDLVTSDAGQRAPSPLPLSLLWMPLAYLPQEALRLEPKASSLEAMVLFPPHALSLPFVLRQFGARPGKRSSPGKAFCVAFCVRLSSHSPL